MLQDLPFHVVPLELVFRGRVWRDGVDLTPEEFYSLLPGADSLPKTSAPKPSSFLSAFKEASAYAQGVLCIAISHRLSGTYDSARVATELALDMCPGLKVQVMDSGTAGGAEALIALAAARAARDGCDLEQVARVAADVASRVYFLGVMETLYYIWKGGRIPKVALWAASLLKLKPVLDLWQGEVRLVARPRTKSKGVERLLEVMAERAKGQRVRVNVMHAAVSQEAAALEGRLRALFPCTELFTTIFTPVIGAHTGPGLLGVAFYTDSPPGP
jgi:DegV family protein with EDD domain